MISGDVVNNNLQIRRQPETTLIDGSVHSMRIRMFSSKEGGGRVIWI